MVEKKIAIIGGGFGGVAIVAAIVRAAVDTHQTELSITIFEPDTIGPGVAYDINSPDAFLLNHELDFMGSLNVHLSEIETKDFYNWVQQNLNTLSNDYASYDLTSPKAYVPRNLFGKYIQARYLELKGYAHKHGVQINEERHKVDNVLRFAGTHARQFGVEVNGSIQAFDAVVLATGNFFNQIDTALMQTGKYFQPYDYNAYMSADIPDRSVMLIAGSALSAYDAAIYALESGKYRKVIMASRRGMLRKVRGRTIPYERKYITVGNLLRLAGGASKHFRLEHLFEAIRAELHDAHKTPVNWKEGYLVDEILGIFKDDISSVENDQILLWRSIHSSLTDNERHELYAHLSDKDKIRFAKEYSSLYQLISAPMPIDNARKIQRFIEEDKLELVNGLERIVYNQEKNGFELHCKYRLDGTPLPVGVTLDESQVKHSIYPTLGDVCIDATGVGRSIQHVPLYSHMLQTGLVANHPAGGIRADMNTRSVIDAAGETVPGLYAVGHMTCGETILPHNSIQLGRACFAAGVHMVDGLRSSVSDREIKDPEALLA